MELLVKRLLDSNYVVLRENMTSSVEMAGRRVDPLLLVATEEGREYVRSLGLETIDWSDEDA